MENFEVIIIGAGTAGLAAATALGRSRRTVLVLDAGAPRNAVSPGAHNVLGLDGISPLELLQRGRREAAGYGVQFRDEPATGLAGSLADGFVVSTAASAYRAQRVLLATGVRDHLPDIPGLRETWGKSLLHCPYCHGWEVRDQRIAVLGVGPMSTHQAKLFSQLSDQVTYINHDPAILSDEDRAILDALSIPVAESAISSLDVDADGQIHGIRLEDGRVQEIDAAVVTTRMEASAGLYESLGGELNETPIGRHIEVDVMCATAIPGVYAAGNVTNLSAMMMASAAAGVMAGSAINFDLVSQKARQIAGKS